MINFTKWYAGIYTLIIILVKTKCDVYSSTCVPSPPHEPIQLNCGKDVIRIPSAKNFSFSIQVLNLTGCSNLKFYYDDWKGYENLKELIIDSVVLSYSQKGNVPLDKFSKLNLTKLTLTHCGLNDHDMWTLPETLHTYNVSNNQYTYLNVSMCPDIEIIDASNNQLIKLPILSNPAPPLLAEFHLRGNSLDELTVEQLAPLCELSIFDWRSPRKTGSAICQCLRLQKWSNLFELDTMEVQCDELPQEIECDLSFTPIKYLRLKCSDADQIPDAVIIQNPFKKFPSGADTPASILQQPSQWQTPFAYFIAILSALLVTATVTYIALQFFTLQKSIADEERTTDLEETESVVEEEPT